MPRADDPATPWAAPGDPSGFYPLGCALSQAAALVGEARVSQASWITSVNSGKVSSPIRLPRTSTDGCPSKCEVVKNGDV